MFFFFQAEDGIRDAQESRGLGDVYKRQPQEVSSQCPFEFLRRIHVERDWSWPGHILSGYGVQVEYYGWACLLYTSDAADDLLCVDLGGRRIIKKNNTIEHA